MKNKLFLLLIVIMLFIPQCAKEEEENPVSSGKRIGAVCNDGTRSSATGSGACSHHGGVAYWLYE